VQSRAFDSFTAERKVYEVVAKWMLGQGMKAEFGQFFQLFALEGFPPGS
jgi:hypothetical protein